MYIGTSGDSAWFQDSPEKFGTVGIFTVGLSKIQVMRKLENSTNEKASYVFSGT